MIPIPSIYEELAEKYGLRIPDEPDPIAELVVRGIDLVEDIDPDQMPPEVEHAHGADE